MPARQYAAANSYRYGFNGQEKSLEIDQDGASMTAEFWQYDARIGRRWNVDPVIKDWESPYSTFSNNPILRVDPNGDSDTAKFLSNSQLLGAVKAAYNVINTDVKAGKYNASNDRAAELNGALEDYFKKNQNEYNGYVAAEFQATMNQYYKGFLEVATRSSGAWERLGQRIYNPEISDATNVEQAAATIHAYNGSTLQLVTYGANTALGIAAGGVGIRAGPGPRGPQINSARYQSIVDAGPSFSSLPKTGELPAGRVRFSQNSIGKTFSDGASLDDVISSLKNGTITSKSIPAIRIVEKDGLIYTLDNRRLYVFQQAGVRIRYQKLDAIPKNENFKFTTTNQGTSVSIRQ
ncbi:MAG: hypothetical protein H6627_14930 [Calditrichae bacterium]|nr:hypothetical protein [Calditrichia bacterium]